MSWNASVGIPLAILGAIVFASIYWFGRPKKPRQGRRMVPPRESGDRIEPTFGACLFDPRRSKILTSPQSL